MVSSAMLPHSKAESASKLIKQLGLPMHVKTFEQGLVLCGDLEVAEYLSSTGNGEIKTFLRLTPSGLTLGKNTYNPFTPNRTDTVFFASSFLVVYARAATAIAKHANEIAHATPVHVG